MDCNCIISLEQTAVVDKMLELGANSAGTWITTQASFGHFVKANPIKYSQAKWLLPPTLLQTQICNALIEGGAQIDESTRHLKTMGFADHFIKQNIQLARRIAKKEQRVTLASKPRKAA